MRRVVQPPPLDTGCAANRVNYTSMARYEAVLKPDLQAKIDMIGGVRGSDLIAMKDSRDVNQNAQYNSLLATLQTTETQLNSVIACLNKDILQRNNESAKIYSLQTEIEAKRKEAEAKKQSVNEAKERAALLENPYSKTTWWEAFFPLGRPIRKENVPVLLSVSILMLVVSLGIFLKKAGLELRLDSLVPTNVYSGSSSVQNLGKR